jgi:hypothetical protein
MFKNFNEIGILNSIRIFLSLSFSTVSRKTKSGKEASKLQFYCRSIDVKWTRKVACVLVFLPTALVNV